MDLDEVALITLLADGVDAPTAYAASVRDDPQPTSGNGRRYFDAGLLIGLVLFVLWLLW